MWLIGSLFLLTGGLLPLVGRGVSADSDVVDEKLSVQPLCNGDFLFVLDLDIQTTKYVHFEEHMAYPGVLMDMIAPDFAKVFLRSHVQRFESVQHSGEWKDAWGPSHFKRFKHGISLQASWSYVYSDLEVHDFFETLAHGLWGITGSQFHILTSRDAVLFDITQISSLEEPVSSKRKAKNLLGTYSEDVFCVDNLYKWRTVLPSLGKSGLLSIVNDERIWSKSPYKGVSVTMSYAKTVLSFNVQFQVVVDPETVTSNIWNVYHRIKPPKSLLGVTYSVVELLVPEPFHEHFDGEDVLSFNFLDESEQSEISTSFKDLYDLTHKGFDAPHVESLTFDVSELESTTLNVLKRVQSSLSILIKNKHDGEKHVKFIQPLPYWANPQLSSITFKLSQYEEDGANELISCSGEDCLQRTVYRENHMQHFGVRKMRTLTLRKTDENHNKPEVANKRVISRYYIDLPVRHDAEFEDDVNFPLIVYEKSEFWTHFGFSIMMPPMSELACRVDIQKNKLTYDEIDYAMHRGQLIHSGIIIESDNAVFDDFSVLDATIHHTGEFFSYIILADSTMAFNVMAGIGVICGLLFGLVFNLGTRKGYAELEMNSDFWENLPMDSG